MGFDKAVQTTFAKVIPDIRDRMTNLTNWSEKDTNASGANKFASGDYTVLTTPTGEDVKLLLQQGEGIAVTYGPDWNATDNKWNDRYKNDLKSQAGDSGSGGLTFSGYGDSISPSDDVTYWLAYADAEGFGTFIHRNMDDGHDGSIAITFAEINKLWDYDAAAVRESDYVTQAYAGGTVGNSVTINMWHLMSAGGESEDSTKMYGRINGDSNFNNYPLQGEHVVASNAYNGTPIGTYDLVFEDLTGAHGDTVKDANGNIEYYLLQKENSPGIALKNL